MLEMPDSRAREERRDLPEQAATVERSVELDLLELQDRPAQREARVPKVQPDLPGHQARPGRLVNRVSRGPVEQRLSANWRTGNRDCS
jgi:hypothetical protein